MQESMETHCAYQINPLGNGSKLGSDLEFGVVPKVVGAFENRLKEQMNYPKTPGITQSDRKVGNHY